MTKEQILEDLKNQIDHAKLSGFLELQQYVTNSEYPLDLKWNAFINYGVFFLKPHNFYVFDWDCFKRFGVGNVINLFRDSWEKGESIYVEELLWELNAIIGDPNYGGERDFLIKNDKEEKGLTKEDIRNFKNECMTKMIYSFKYDW